MTISRRIILGSAFFGAGSAIAVKYLPMAFSEAQAKGNFPYSKSDSQWRASLTKMQYYVLRKAGTERAFSNALHKEKRKGYYKCAGCQKMLFSSSTKFDSGTGWPSFYRPLKGATATSTDHILGYARTEVHCANCGGHLGHIFNDGPKPTGKRYCVNGAALTFRAA